jgi:VanZ family protein
MRTAKQLLFLVTITTIIVLSLLPGSMKVRTFIPDSLAHLGAYALVACTAAIVVSSWERPLIGLVLSGIALTLEAIQWPLPDRDASLIDFVVSAAGAWIGLGAAFLGETFAPRLAAVGAPILQRLRRVGDRRS